MESKPIAIWRDGRLKEIEKGEIEKLVEEDRPEMLFTSTSTFVKWFFLELDKNAGDDRLEEIELDHKIRNYFTLENDFHICEQCKYKDNYYDKKQPCNTCINHEDNVDKRIGEELKQSLKQTSDSSEGVE